MNLGGPEAIILIALLLVLFGGSQLPKLARNLGQAQRELRSAMDDNDEEPPSSDTGESLESSPRL